MKRKCKDCSKTFVTTKDEMRMKRQEAEEKGDEMNCMKCWNEHEAIRYDHSYFGSIASWGACDPSGY